MKPDYLDDRAARILNTLLRPPYAREMIWVVLYLLAMCVGMLH
ncbi:hypothetical protein [Frigidibacter sp. ROC022]|nr:hypothetical protein [Frigidibacter sp. ROC022]MCR8723117.1 hypothetical protein [Frigidibacter sp. ROC022]